LPILGCSCCTEGCCLSADATPYPIGMVSPDAFTFIGKDGHCCAIGLPCCFIGLKSPSTLCNSAGHCLCVKSRAQCPCGDAVPSCVCAACFLSCTPQCACFRTPDVATCKFKSCCVTARRVTVTFPLPPFSPLFVSLDIQVFSATPSRPTDLYRPTEPTLHFTSSPNLHSVSINLSCTTALQVHCLPALNDHASSVVTQ
jgi:hypothetical protein